MLNLQNFLLFPTIKLTQSVPGFHRFLKVKDSLYNGANITKIYYLDWEKVEAIKLQRWQDSGPCKRANEAFPGTIPQEFMDWAKDMQFAITEASLEEIRHHSLKAVEEWIRKKPETHWEPIPTRSLSSSYIQKAFNLIADCLYDSKTNHYSRDEKKVIVPYLLSYRFWTYQTKPDNLMLYTGILDFKLNLENELRVNEMKKKDPQEHIIESEFNPEGCIFNHDLNFIKSIEDHIQSLENRNEKAAPSSCIWIEDEQTLKKNIIPGLKEKSSDPSNTPHFMGINIGLKDGTAIVICHIKDGYYHGHSLSEDNADIEIDCMDVRYASEEGKNSFSPEEIAEWIASYNDKFNIVKGVMDQYYACSILPSLKERGMTQIEAVQNSRAYHSEIFRNLKDYMIKGSLRIPENKQKQDKKGRKVTFFPIKELLSLRATTFSNEIVTVAAPPRGPDGSAATGSHDELSNALARAVFIASKYTPQVIMNATLKDFIESNRSSVTVDDTDVFIPESCQKTPVGKGLHLINPTLKRSGPYSSRAFGKLTISNGLKLTISNGLKLTAELDNLFTYKDRVGSTITLPDGGFTLKDDSCTIEVLEFTILSFSGTPPPVITIRIDKFKIVSELRQGQRPVRADMKAQLALDDPNGVIVKTVDFDKMKEESFGRYLDSKFDHIDVITTDHKTLCLSPKKSK